MFKKEYFIFLMGFSSNFWHGFLIFYRENLLRCVECKYNIIHAWYEKIQFMPSFPLTPSWLILLSIMYYSTMI